MAAIRARVRGIAGSAEAWIEHARGLLREGRFDEAVSLCEEELSRRPGSLSVRLLRGRALLGAGRHREASLELEECYRSGATDEEVHRLLAILDSSADAPPRGTRRGLAVASQPLADDSPTRVVLGTLPAPAPAPRPAPAKAPISFSVPLDLLPAAPYGPPPRPLALVPAPAGARLTWPAITLLIVATILVAAARLRTKSRSTAPVSQVAMASLLSQPIAPIAPSAPPTVPSHALDLPGDTWIHPLAGPVRRMPIRDSRTFGAERPGERPVECRSGHCGVDLGGDIYREPIMAAHDGIVDRVQRGPNRDHGGLYVRLSHRGGTVFTQYFHLAEIPSRLMPGTVVRAGDVIGLLGHSGVKNSGPHLHFTVSVRPDPMHTEQYIDPEPLIALWPLRIRGQNGEGALSLGVAPGVPRGSSRSAARRRRAHRGVD
jgi:murein DD-endopeptidase MepM/ murein hydrolase activator NlpD